MILTRTVRLTLRMSFEQHWTLGKHLYSATMLDDSNIRDDGVDRKFANGVQRTLTEFWTQIDKAYPATKNPNYQIPIRC